MYPGFTSVEPLARSRWRCGPSWPASRSTATVSNTAWLLGDLVRAVEPCSDLADLAHGLGGECHRVGTHVGDQADAALADVLPLVQLLREAHGAARIETELARGLLLERRGGEGRSRVAAALLAVD